MKTQSEDTIFVGREEELTRLMAFAKDAFAGKAGVAFVTGEAGIGKTFLVEEFFRQLRKEYEDVVIASSQCTIQSASYLPFQAILEDLLESQKKVKVSGKKLQQVTEVVIDTIWNVGPDLIGIFGIPIRALQTIVDKLGLRGKKSAAEFEIPEDLDQIEIFGWYTKIMKDISVQFPLVLFIDDLHWADDSSLNLLLHLGLETKNQRMLIISTYRPHEATPNSLLMQVKTKLCRYGARKFPLDVSEDKAEDVKKTQQFVHAYLVTNYGTNFSDRFEQVLVDRTEGNALFLTEILKNLEEKGQIIPGSAGILSANGSSKEEVVETSKMPALPGTPWQLTKEIETIEDLPEKVENVISERVNRLEAALREILDYASVEGDDFIAQVIAKVRQIQERNLINDLTKKLMKTYQLIWERDGKSLPNGQRIHEFSFRHNLIREYIYAQLSETDKEFIHAEIGECLERLYEPNTDEIASQLAVHFFHGHVLDKAMRYCLKAAQDANRRYGASETVQFGKMGLEALEQQVNVLSREEYAENKVRLLLELVKAEEFGGNPQEEKDHIQAGISYLEDNLSLLNNVSDELHAEVYMQLGRLYDRKKGSAKPEAKRYLERALEIYKHLNNQKNVAKTLYQLSEVYPYISDSGERQTPANKGIETLRRSLSIAEDLQEIKLQSRCLSLLTKKYIFNRKSFSEEEQFALQALKLSIGLDKYTHIKALNAMAEVSQGYVKHKTAIRYLKESLELARQIGDLQSETEALSNIEFNHCCYVTSLENIQSVLEKIIGVRDQVGLRKSNSLRILGEMFGKQGKWQDAEKCFQKAIQDSTKRGQSFQRYHIGILYMLQGKYTQATKEFQDRIDTLEEYQISQHSTEYVEIAMNYALAGENSKCNEYLKATQSLLAQETLPYYKWNCLYKISEVHRILGEFESARTSCQQSLEWLLTDAEDPEELVYVAEARLIMGKILVDMNEYQEAFSYLDKAKAAFKICGHYALGETLLYLGKAHQGLGGPVLLRQAREYVTSAIAEFQRLELAHKEREAKEVLEQLPLERK